MEFCLALHGVCTASDSSEITFCQCQYNSSDIVQPFGHIEVKVPERRDYYLNIILQKKYTVKVLTITIASYFLIFLIFFSFKFIHLQLHANYKKILFFQYCNLFNVSQMAAAVEITRKVTVLKIWKHSKR